MDLTRKRLNCDNKHEEDCDDFHLPNCSTHSVALSAFGFSFEEEQEAMSDHGLTGKQAELELWESDAKAENTCVSLLLLHCQTVACRSEEPSVH